MTQAFNLSQFANKVNTSGQADLTTAVTGVLPVANGGTGLSSPGTSGNVLRSNGSVWTSASIADYAGNRGQVFDTGAVFTASQSTTVMTVTAVQKGTLYVGQVVYSTGFATRTISSFGTGSGGTGTYNMSASMTVSSRQHTGGGTGTFTIPTGITALKVTVVGGGGMGGNVGALGVGAGGGGGGSAIKYFTGLTPGGTIAVTLGTATGTSSVSSGTQSISTVSATGGATGTTGWNSTGVGGAGGLGSGGDMNGAGGQGCFSLPVGNCAGNDYTVFGGGGTILASGAGTKTGNGAGNNSLFGGAGGGGAYNGSNSGSYSAGAGAPGVVIFEW